MRGGPWRAGPLLAVFLLPLFAACGGGEPPLRVAAAASLVGVLPEIVKRFEEAHPDVDVELRFAGSQVLAAQIEEGAATDVFIAANDAQARRLRSAGLAVNSRVVAGNRLVVAVDVASELYSVDQLAEPGVRIAIAAPLVPVGALTEDALGRLDPTVADGIRANVITQDPSVRIVLSRLQIGEADAVFVYATDLAAANAREVALPSGIPSNPYVAVELEDAHAATGAFIDFLLSAEVQQLLSDAGFERAAADDIP